MTRKSGVSSNIPCCHKCQLQSEEFKEDQTAAEENIPSLNSDELSSFYTCIYSPCPCPCLTETRWEAVLFGEPDISALRVVTLSFLSRFSINPTAPAWCGVHKDNCAVASMSTNKPTLPVQTCAHKQLLVSWLGRIAKESQYLSKPGAHTQLSVGEE